MPSNPHGILPSQPLDDAGLEALTARLVAARELAWASPAWLDFRQSVLVAQRAVLADATAPLPPLRLPAPEGGPLLDHTALELPPAALAELWAALVSALRELGRPEPSLDAMELTAAEEPGFLEALARAAVADEPAALEAIAGRFEAPVPALAFLGRALIAPFVAAATRLVSADHIATSGRPSGACPFCGGPAGLAVLSREGEGKRHLCCGLCGARWAFPRLRCAACDNEDQQRLGFLKTDHEAPTWVEVCEACKAALETVDERRLPMGAVVLPAAEAFLGLHLELLARREGYLPPPEWVAGA